MVIVSPISSCSTATDGTWAGTTPAKQWLGFLELYVQTIRGPNTAWAYPPVNVQELSVGKPWDCVFGYGTLFTVYRHQGTPSVLCAVTGSIDFVMKICLISTSEHSRCFEGLLLKYTYYCNTFFYCYQWFKIFIRAEYC